MLAVSASVPTGSAENVAVATVIGGKYQEKCRHNSRETQDTAVSDIKDKFLPEEPELQRLRQLVIC